MTIYKVEVISVHDTPGGWDDTVVVNQEKYCLSYDKAMKFKTDTDNEYKEYNATNYHNDIGNKIVTRLVEIEVEE